MTSNCRIYVGNLPKTVRKRDLEDVFDKYGPIQSVDIHDKFDPAFAFIEFDDPRDAEDAVYGKDGGTYEGQILKVQFPRGSDKFKLNPTASNRSGSGRGFRNNGGGYSGGGSSGGRGGGRYIRGRGAAGPIRRSNYRVLVSGLPTSGSWQDLKDHMREAGEVLYTDVYKDGTGVVEYGTLSDLNWAVKNLDDTKFVSHESETTYIRVKSDESHSRSRSRSPKRRRSVSPRRRSRSPRRRSRSPGRRSRSPKRRSRSPPRRSRSPRRRSQSPRRRSRSPDRRRSRSPPLNSPSPHRSSRSPLKQF